MKPKEAIVLLESLKLVFSNDKGEPISDVYYALDLAINSLKDDSEEVREIVEVLEEIKATNKV